MERLFQGNISDLSQRFELPKGLKLSGIYIAFVGVNQAGQTLSLDNCGTVQLLKNGSQIDLWDFGKMAHLNNLTGGVYPNVSGAGAAFHLGCLRSSYMFSDEKDNCLFTDPAQKWELIHTFPTATGTIVASGTVRYLGELADNSAVQHYLYRYQNHDFTIAGAGTFNYQIRQDNIRALLIENDSNLTSLTVLKDGKAVVNQIERGDLYGLTQLRHRIETFSTSTPYILVDLNPSGENFGSLSDEVSVVLNMAGAATLAVMAISQDLTPNAQNSSLMAKDQHLTQKIQSKELKGLTQVSTAIRNERSSAA